MGWTQATLPNKQEVHEWRAPDKPESRTQTVAPGDLNVNPGDIDEDPKDVQNGQTQWTEVAPPSDD